MLGRKEDEEMGYDARPAPPCPHLAAGSPSSRLGSSRLNPHPHPQACLQPLWYCDHWQEDKHTHPGVGASATEGNISMDEKRNSDKRELSQEFCAVAALGCFGKNGSNYEKPWGFLSAKVPALILSVTGRDMMKAGSRTNISFDHPA